MGESLQYFAWVIRHWNGKRLYPDTVRRTRRESIAAFKKQYGVSDKAWRDDVKYGVHRCVRAAVQEWAGR